MIEFINRLTGTQMWVDEKRMEEYKAAGHKLAAKPEKPASAPRKKPVKK